MTDIPNTEYIAISPYKLLVGGRNHDIEYPNELFYRGKRIYSSDAVKGLVQDIRIKCPNVYGLHVMSSAAPGKYAVSGNPVANGGVYEWARFEYKNGEYGPWVYVGEESNPDFCAHMCAWRCGLYVRNDENLRNALLKPSEQKSILTLYGQQIHR